MGRSPCPSAGGGRVVPHSAQHTVGRKAAPPWALKPSPSARLPRGTLVAYNPGTSLPVVSQKEREAPASPLRVSASSSENKVSDQSISTLPRTCLFSPRASGLGMRPLGRLRRTGAPHGTPGGRRGQNGHTTAQRFQRTSLGGQPERSANPNQSLTCP